MLDPAPQPTPSQRRQSVARLGRPAPLTAPTRDAYASRFAPSSSTATPTGRAAVLEHGPEESAPPCWTADGRPWTSRRWERQSPDPPPGTDPMRRALRRALLSRVRGDTRDRSWSFCVHRAVGTRAGPRGAVHNILLARSGCSRTYRGPETARRKTGNATGGSGTGSGLARGATALAAR